MIEFGNVLEEHLLDKANDWVGSMTDPADVVKTFDDHLHDFDLDVDPEPWPFLVVTARQSTKSGEAGEIGQPHDLRTWLVHIYYIDIVKEYSVGKLRRRKLLGKLEKELEKDHRLGGLQTVDDDGTREYVYDLEITDVLFDSSGQEEYYSFVSELYLNVFTATST